MTSPLRSWIAFALFTVAGASCSTKNPGAVCTVSGHTCLSDSECCTSYCLLQGQAAYCQDKPPGEAQCAQGGEFCTQNRHCCAGLCDANACVGSTGGGATPCKADGAACASGLDCCSSVCGGGGRATTCQPPTRVGGRDGGSCVGGGMSCATPGECCSGYCVPVPGGKVCGKVGGGGGTCGKSGAACRVQADCCSQQCDAASSLCR